MIDRNRSEGTSSATPENPDKSTAMSFLEYVRLYPKMNDEDRARIIDVLEGKIVPALNNGFEEFEEEAVKSEK
jgi:hypothetical protein